MTLIKKLDEKILKYLIKLIKSSGFYYFFQTLVKGKTQHTSLINLMITRTILRNTKEIKDMKIRMFDMIKTETEDENLSCYRVFNDSLFDILQCIWYGHSIEIMLYLLLFGFTFYFFSNELKMLIYSNYIFIFFQDFYVFLKNKFFSKKTEFYLYFAAPSTFKNLFIKHHLIGSNKNFQININNSKDLLLLNSLKLLSGNINTSLKLINN